MAQRFTFIDLKPPVNDFLADVLAGLSSRPKQLHCKYFYDSRGSLLFERISELPEYYLTRSEMAILRRHRPAIARVLGERCLVIEYGSGSARKTPLLLDALEQPAGYVPIDIAPEPLQRAAADIAQAYPRLPVAAVCADYTRPLELPELPGVRARRRAVFFPGSTIGNFDPEEARRFLRTMRELAGDNGAAIIGVDTRKDVATLEAAYNDRRGVTAEFNLNLLARVNRELGADFDLSAFRHHARYDEQHGRIEMYLVSERDQTVHIGDVAVSFGAGETIHTENSYKYSVQEFQALAAQAGWSAEQVWTDPLEMFSVHALRAEE